VGTLGTETRRVKEIQTNIETNRKKIDCLRADVRNDEDSLPGKQQDERRTQDRVNKLLVALEKEQHLRIRRDQPSGPVVQGGRITFHADYDKKLPNGQDLPPEVKLSWNTGGAPSKVSEGDQTMTIYTSAVAPGNHDISVAFAWKEAPTDSSTSIKKEFQ
jgi:hypothetical protein